MPFLDAHAVVDRALDSLGWQTYKDFELILVDDGSNKEFPEEELENYSFPWKLLRRERVAGAGSARNWAIQESSGEFIFPLDADDILIPTALERLMSNIGHYDVLYPNFQVFGAENHLINSGDFEPAKLERGNFIINSSLYRKSIWEKVREKNHQGYNEQIMAWEDWMFWIEAMRCDAAFHHFPEWLVWVSRSETSRNSITAKARTELRNFIYDRLQETWGEGLRV